MKKKKQQAETIGEVETIGTTIHPKLYHMFLEPRMLIRYMGQMTSKMISAAEEEEFEKAASYKRIVEYNKSMAAGFQKRWNIEDTENAEL